MTKNFFRHYRLPFRHRHGFKQIGLGLEARGGVTLCVRMEPADWPTPLTDGVVSLSVGTAVCGPLDNYCRASGRGIAEERQATGLTGTRKPRSGNAYAFYPTVLRSNVEAVLQGHALACIHNVYGRLGIAQPAILLKVGSRPRERAA